MEQKSVGHWHLLSRVITWAKKARRFLTRLASDVGTLVLVIYLTTVFIAVMMWISLINSSKFCP